MSKCCFAISRFFVAIIIFFDVVRTSTIYIGSYILKRMLKLYMNILRCEYHVPKYCFYLAQCYPQISIVVSVSFSTIYDLGSFVSRRNLLPCMFYFCILLIYIMSYLHDLRQGQIPLFAYITKLVKVIITLFS